MLYVIHISNNLATSGSLQTSNYMGNMRCLVLFMMGCVTMFISAGASVSPWRQYAG